MSIVFRPAGGRLPLFHNLNGPLQHIPVGDDRLVGCAQMFLGAILNRAGAFHRPLVVNVDVPPPMPV